MGWSTQLHRTADRRFFAQLDSVGGGGWSGGISGTYYVFETATAHVIGTLPYSMDGGDADPVVVEFDYEDETKKRLVARTILAPHCGSDEVLATHTFDVPIDEPLPGPPPKEPALHLELESDPTPARLRNLVDAVRGRLCCDLDDRCAPRDRDPRTVRLVEGNRVAVILGGDDEDDVLARIALDRPSILTAPPLSILPERITGSLGGQLPLEFRLTDLPKDGEPTLPLDLHRDGVPCGAITSVKGTTARGFVRFANDYQELTRTLLYPLHVRAIASSRRERSH